MMASSCAKQGREDGQRSAPSMPKSHRPWWSVVSLLTVRTALDAAGMVTFSPTGSSVVGVDFPQAIRDLAAVAGIAMPSGEWQRPARGAPVVRTEKRLDEGDQIKPDLPSLRHLRPLEIEQLAAVRGLSVEAVRLE